MYRIMVCGFTLFLFRDREQEKARCSFLKYALLFAQRQQDGVKLKGRFKLTSHAVIRPNYQESHLYDVYRCKV